MKRKNLTIRLAALAVAAAAAHTPVAAADWTDKISIHGYGGWAAGASDNYAYLQGSEESQPEARNVTAALHFDFAPNEDLRFSVVPFWEATEDGDEVSLDVAAMQWDRSDRLRVRFGRSRLPFGIYTDVFDIGTLRPLFNLSQSLYGPTGLVTESYDGVGANGRLFSTGGWDMTYDLYAGGATFEVEEPFESVVSPLEQGDSSEVAEATVERLLGVRVVVATPVDGLSLGLSAFAAKPEESGDFAVGGNAWGDFASYGAHADFDRGPWLVRAEVGRHEEDEFETDAAYLEVARRFGSHWQVAARADRVRSDFVVDLPARLESLLRHDELSFGVSYWVAEGLALRLSAHQIDGNLFAHPSEAELQELATEGSPDESSRLVIFGAQFSF